MKLGVSELIVLALLAALIVLPIWGAVQAARDNRPHWMFGMIAGLFLQPLGPILAVFYLTRRR
ncbi:MAG: hypothetical protein AAGE98_13855 [Actinomycetota bacterium]